MATPFGSLKLAAVPVASANAFEPEPARVETCASEAHTTVKQMQANAATATRPNVERNETRKRTHKRTHERGCPREETRERADVKL